MCVWGGGDPEEGGIFVSHNKVYTYQALQEVLLCAAVLCSHMQTVVGNLNRISNYEQYTSTYSIKFVRICLRSLASAH